jgi:FixJ family two-component response regulator
LDYQEALEETFVAITCALWNKPMGSTEPFVFVVDDDPSVRKLIAQLLLVSGYKVETFATAQSFLQANRNSSFSCLILDLQLPGFNGLELQQELAERANLLPIIFITGQGDIPASVKALKAGAVDFLAKPVSEEALLSAVRQALERSRRESEMKSSLARIHKLLATLTARETEVLLHVAAGRSNKQVAGELGIAEPTVKLHRARIMKKLCVQSTGEMVLLAVKAGLPLVPHRFACE